MNTIESAKALLRFSALAVLLVLANATPAQQVPPEAPGTSSQKEKEQEQRQELEKKTLALLNDVASAAWSLKLPENRMFVMSNSADLMWTFDEKRARNLYWEAINALNLIAPPARRSGENPTREERRKIVQGYLSHYALRRNLLRQVAKRDAQLALDMLRGTRQVAPPRDWNPLFFYPDDRQLEQEIASEVAARDPAQALQLARESLEKGITYELLNLLLQLNEKDQAKASEFAGDIISKLRVTNVVMDIRASQVGVQLLQISRMPDPDGPPATQSTAGVIRLSDDEKRDLVDVLTSAALNVSANSNLLFNLPNVMPEIQQFFPERRAGLEQKLVAFNQTLSSSQQNQNPFNGLIERGDPEEIVRRAANESEGERLSLYQQAAVIAVVKGTTDSFRELVSKEIKNPDEQRNILERMDAEEINVAVGRKLPDELKKLLPKIQRNEERARAMVEMALLLKEQGKDAEAVTVLDEAAGMIKTDLKSPAHTNALLTLLCAYALIDPPRAFALAERIIDHANTQISLLLLVDKVVKSGSVKKSEIILGQGGMLPMNVMVFKYGKGVAALAAADFSRTKALAERFERNELRIMARLLLVEGILRPGPTAQNY